MRPLLEVLRYPVQGDVFVELRGAVLGGFPVRSRAEDPYGVGTPRVEPFGESAGVRLGVGRHLRHHGDGAVDGGAELVRGARGDPAAGDAEPQGEAGKRGG